MILSGAVIAEERGILIDPFDSALVNPSSYDLTLGDEACVYVRSESVAKRYSGETYSCWMNMPEPPSVLDARRQNPSLRFRLDPERGFRIGGGNNLYQRRVFLLHTREVIAPGLEHVAVVDGKSSLGRLGLVVHATAGYVDPGFSGQITLECAALGEDVIVYPGMRIAQVRFVRLGFSTETRKLPNEGRLSYEQQGHYVGEASRGPVSSRSYLQFEREPKTDPVPPPAECSICSRPDCDNPNGKH